MAKFSSTLSHQPLLRFADNLRPGAAEVVKETAEDIKADIETAMQLPKSGRVYDGHQASAPGDAPAVDSGELIGSLVVEMVGPFAAEVRAEDPKAAMLEYGTLNEDGSVRMAPRPSMTPAAEANRLPFQDKVEDLLNGRR